MGEKQLINYFYVCPECRWTVKTQKEADVHCGRCDKDMPEMWRDNC